jgi:hypothetical protein
MCFEHGIVESQSNNARTYIYGGVHGLCWTGIETSGAARGVMS